MSKLDGNNTERKNRNKTTDQYLSLTYQQIETSNA